MVQTADVAQREKLFTMRMNDEEGITALLRSVTGDR